MGQCYNWVDDIYLIVYIIVISSTFWLELNAQVKLCRVDSATQQAQTGQLFQSAIVGHDLVRYRRMPAGCPYAAVSFVRAVLL